MCVAVVVGVGALQAVPDADVVVAVEVAPLAFVHAPDERVGVVSAGDFAAARGEGDFEVEVLGCGWFGGGVVAAVEGYVGGEGPRGFGGGFVVGVVGGGRVVGRGVVEGWGVADVGEGKGEEREGFGCWGFGEGIGWLGEFARW